MPPTDFARHNEEVRLVWESYHAGRPIRVPFGPLGINPRIWVLDPHLNIEGITWEQFSNDPELMFQVCLRYRDYVAHTIPQDCEMGIPASHWEVHAELGNVWEEAWLGSPIIYPQGQVSATLPRFTGSRKEEIFERGMPGPFDGIAGLAREFYEYFVERARSYEFHHRPVRVLAPYPVGTDGPFTVAIGVRGTELLEDMLLDEEYYHRLMDFIVEAIIRRVRAWREYLGVELPPVRVNFADDDIQYLSLRQYRELVLPYHKRLMAALYGAGPHAMHLCGNVQRHLPTIVRELNVKSFDTGFPIDFTTLRDEVGEEVEIQGGVPVADLVQGTSAQVFARAEAILKSGILRGGRFILKEANNLPPQTPLENIEAMYAAARGFGQYRRE
jgi:hypothetical protein